VLTRGHLDDGRGKARVALFRHKHEIETGRTSSSGNEILAFDHRGEAILPAEHAKQHAAWEAIAAKASKVTSFTDLAGHEKYLKTTLSGLTGSNPDFVLLIVGANAGIIGLSKEHLSVALALSLPIVCIVTKVSFPSLSSLFPLLLLLLLLPVFDLFFSSPFADTAHSSQVDMTPAPVYEQTIKQLVKVLKSPGCRKKPVFVEDHGMACSLAESFATEKACPIFRVSNVSGEGLPLLKTFLNVVRPSNSAEYPVNAPFEFAVHEAYSVPYVGTVLSGVIMSGVRPLLLSTSSPPST
jgi:GTPase